MKRLPILFLLFHVILTGCGNQETANTTSPSSDKGSGSVQAQRENLANFLKKHEVPSQHFTLTSSQQTQVKGKKGTVVQVVPSDLETVDGQPLGETIEVELKELTNQGELLRSNAQTVSDGKLLVSGGAYYIHMSSGGKPLRLKQGKAVSVVFPKLSDKEMALFYGQRDSLGQMNWRQAGQNFTTKRLQAQKPVAATADTNKAKRNSSGLDALIDYIESGDTTITAAERKAIEKAQKDYKLSQKVYEAIKIESFGWINCDRFLDMEQKTDVLAAVSPQDSISSAAFYLVFKDINSVLQENFISGQQNGNLVRFKELPIGYKTRLIAYTVKNGQVYAYSSDVRIADKQTIDLRFTPVSEKEFASLLGK